MKAIVYHDYGSPDVLAVEDVEKPTPAESEVVLRVRAAAVNPLDWHYISGTPYPIRMQSGLRRPRNMRPGIDVAGVVDAVGGSVTSFKPGDQVFGAGRGTFAEYATASESALILKPDRLTFEQAAAVPVAGFTALRALRDSGRIRAGHEVLVNGASGGVGTFAVQIAKSFGAEVTGVCSTTNVDMVRSIGADHVIDYTRADFTKGAARYDLFLDCIGNHPLSACRRVLSAEGMYVIVGAPSGRWIAPLGRMLRVIALSPFVGKRMVVAMGRLSREDLTVLRELVETGKVRPVVDRSYTLSEVPDAVRHVATGHARGKVVITVE